MKRKKIGWVLSLMVLAIVLVVPSVSRSLAVDLDGNCSLSFGSEYMDDLKSFGAVDVFQVAVAQEETGYDSYRFTANDTFASLDLNASSNEQYLALAQEAAQIVLDENLTGTSAMLSDTLDLASGLYLVMPHTENVSLADSIEYGRDELGGLNRILSVVNTDQYKYLFTPTLVALPSRDGELGNNTANPTDWTYDVTMTLKASRDLRTDGQIEIVKNVPSFGGSGSATFVFNITATLDGEELYSNVETLVFDNAGTNSVTIENLPVGAQIRVEEVYSGANFTNSGSSELIQVLESGNETLSFEFTNEYDGRNNHGTSVTNRYTFEEVPEGSLDVDQGGNQ